MSRTMGVLLLKAPAYKEIAEDPKASATATVIIFLALLVSGFVEGFVTIDQATVAASANFIGGIIGAIVELVFGLIAWFVSAWITASVARWFFQGHTDTGEMLRVSGYTKLFSFFSVLSLVALVSPMLVCVVAPIMMLVSIFAVIGNVLGIREAAEFSTGKAIITGLIAGAIRFLIEATAAAAVLAMIVGTLAAVNAGLGG